MDLRWLDSFSWTIVILACATLGLAPFNPPHIVEKLGMLSFEGTVNPEKILPSVLLLTVGEGLRGILVLALITNFVTMRLRRLPVGRAWEALREDG